MQKPLYEPLATEELSRFLLAARRFCDFLADLDLLDPPTFLRRAQLQLLSLYCTVTELEWVNLQVDTDFEETIPQAHFGEILALLDHKLGANRYYWSIWNPASLEPEQPDYGDLLDDLGDIYKDLKRALTVFDLDLPNSKENALWEFKFAFENHWGTHCIDAVRAIHFFLRQEKQ